MAGAGLVRQSEALGRGGHAPVERRTDVAAREDQSSGVPFSTTTTVSSVSALDAFRCEVLRSVAHLESRTAPWSAFRGVIDRRLGAAPTPRLVFELGAHLKEALVAFPWDGTAGHAAKAGKAWEILVCWYLNLVFWGTNVVAVLPVRGTVPSVLADALVVRIRNVETTKETDLVVFSVPEQPAGAALGVEEIDRIIRRDPKQCRLGVIQCKTNWNENAQIPMLWNIVYLYSMMNQHVPNVSVGRNGVSPQSFEQFSYSFATVPTNTPKGPTRRHPAEDPLRMNRSFSATSTPVVRVSALSGGNYWGVPTIPSVADALSEYFGRNFLSQFSGGVQAHIGRTVLGDPSVLRRFLDFAF